MTTAELEQGARRPAVLAPRTGIVDYLTTTDHKRIGLLYLFTGLGFFLLSGALSLLMRAELTFPDLQFMDEATYNQLFTMHGTVMIFFFASPVVFGLANYFIPLQIGAPDMAFPRLNALTYWLCARRRADRVAPGSWSAGRRRRLDRLRAAVRGRLLAGHGSNLWIVGLAFSGISASSAPSTSWPRSSRCVRRA